MALPALIKPWVRDDLFEVAEWHQQAGARLEPRDRVLDEFEAVLALVCEVAAKAGKSHRTLSHIRLAAHTVFDALWREELVDENPVTRVKVPKRKRDHRERAVLTDEELAIYLAWEHPLEQHKLAVMERQVMSVVSRTFGGLRTGDLHALQWQALDVENGRFAFGWAPRRKTSRPQKLEIPEVLRPFLRDWWTRQGKPTTGLVFPALRGKNAGHGVKDQVSHAHSFRRDLQRAFKAARERGVTTVPTEGAARWTELFIQRRSTRSPSTSTAGGARTTKPSPTPPSMHSKQRLPATRTSARTCATSRTRTSSRRLRPRRCRTSAFLRVAAETCER